MPLLELDDDVYQHLLRHSVKIGEDGSSILRRLLDLPQPGARDSDVPVVPPPVAKSDGVADLEAFITDSRFAASRNVTSRYLSLLSFLAKKHGNDFEKVLKVRGRRRIYFGRSQEEIARSGKSLHPQRVPGTEYWAMTNADTAQKRDIIAEVLTVLEYPRDAIHSARRAIS